MKYKFEIIETLQRVVDVEAENEQIANKLVEKQYKESKIILDSEDYKTTQIELIK